MREKLQIRCRLTSGASDNLCSPPADVSAACRALSGVPSSLASANSRGGAAGFFRRFPAIAASIRRADSTAEFPSPPVSFGGPASSDLHRRALFRRWDTVPAIISGEVRRCPECCRCSLLSSAVSDLVVRPIIVPANLGICADATPRAFGLVLSADLQIEQRVSFEILGRPQAARAELLGEAFHCSCDPWFWIESRGKSEEALNSHSMREVLIRLGDRFSEKWAKAAGLVANADRVISTNLGMVEIALRNAAEIYESIGKPQSAATFGLGRNRYDLYGEMWHIRTQRCGELFCNGGMLDPCCQSVMPKGSVSLSVCQFAPKEGCLTPDCGS